jgi:hypothetical protein
MAENGRLSARQQKAILALLTEPNIREAARVVKVGERTLHTWLKDQTFCLAYHEARATAVSQAIARLQRASGEAVDTLAEVMGDHAAGAFVRVTAATKILEMAIKGIEIAELQRRLNALEEAAEAEEPDARAD